jgi:hypothetical protein
LKLSGDGPAKLTHLKVHLKPDAVPRRAKARRYTPKHLDFMSKKIKLLEEMRYIRRNPYASWIWPVLIVPKPKLPNDVKMILNTRYLILVIVWRSLILEVFLQQLELASVFASLDAFKRFWQFSLDVDCQEIYFWLADVEIFTPERKVQGNTDAAHELQAVMYDSINSLLFQCASPDVVWEEDIL